MKFKQKYLAGAISALGLGLYWQDGALWEPPVGSATAPIATITVRVIRDVAGVRAASFPPTNVFSATLRDAPVQWPDSATILTSVAASAPGAQQVEVEIKPGAVAATVKPHRPRSRASRPVERTHLQLNLEPAQVLTQPVEPGSAPPILAAGTSETPTAANASDLVAEPTAPVALLTDADGRVADPVQTIGHDVAETSGEAASAESRAAVPSPVVSVEPAADYDNEQDDPGRAPVSVDTSNPLHWKEEPTAAGAPTEAATTLDQDTVEPLIQAAPATPQESEMAGSAPVATASAVPVESEQGSDDDQDDPGRLPVALDTSNPLHRKEESTAAAPSQSVATLDLDAAERALEVAAAPQGPADSDSAEEIADVPVTTEINTLERLGDASPIVTWHMSRDALVQLTPVEAAEVLATLAGADHPENGPAPGFAAEKLLDAIGPLDVNTLDLMHEMLPAVAWHMSDKATNQLTPSEAADVLVALAADETSANGSPLPAQGEPFAAAKPLSAARGGTQGEAPGLPATVVHQAASAVVAQTPSVNKLAVGQVNGLPDTPAEMPLEKRNTDMSESSTSASATATGVDIPPGGLDAPSPVGATGQSAATAATVIPVPRTKETTKPSLIEMAMQRAATAPIIPEATPATQPAEADKSPLIELAMRRAAGESQTKAATAVRPSAAATVVKLVPAGRSAQMLEDEERGRFLGDKLALSGSQLDEMRGGFETNTGLMISFGIEQAVYINGSLVTTTSINIPDVNKIVSDSLSASGIDPKTLTLTQNRPGNTAQPGATPASGDTKTLTLIQSGQGSTAQPGAIPALGDIKTLTLIQNGPGNTVQLGAMPASGIATVIQNTLDNQKIQALTVINATVNSADVLRALNLQSVLRDALGNSARR